jgi:tetrahydromethanopterin S-methyltransferase subunit H
MTASDWTGVVGAVTGFIGLVVSVSAYRKSNQIKSLDMRIELRKVIGESHESLTNLRSLIDYAAGSRRGILAATGRVRSGAMQHWEQALAADRAEIDRITAALRSEDGDFAALPTDNLEAELVAAYRLKARLSTLVEKYRAEVTADNESRRQLSEQQTAIAAARMQAPTRPR